MMRWIIGSSIRLRHVVVAAAALMLIFGFTQLDQLPFDALPEFSRPSVEIQTEALGLSAQEVEAMITAPFEADMLNGTPWVAELRSQSSPGLSTIWLIFEEGTDILRARQVVQERMTEVFALPNVSTPPTMLNPLSSTARVMEVGLTSESLSLIEMSVLARWTIVPRLMGLPGVANVSIWGQRKRQLQVQVDPEQLRDEGVTLSQVISTSGNALWSSPLSYLQASTPGTGGWIETPNQRLGVRHLLPITTAGELARVALDGDASKRLGDVANVVEDHQPLIGDALVDDAPALMLVVEKFPWANTIEVTEEVEEALAGLQPGLTGLNMDPTLFRPATYLDQAFNNLGLALLVGGALGLLALVAFFLNWRVAAISVVSILSAGAAAGTVLYLRGATLNMMVVAGLLLAIGVVVDDVVVDMDSIRKRLRQSRERGDGMSIASVILHGAVEGRRPLLYATVMILMFVMPLFLVEGVTGAFVTPLAGSYVMAFLASMLVALTVTVALSWFLLRGGSDEQGESALAASLGRAWDGLGARIAAAPQAAFIAVCVLAAAGLGATAMLTVESVQPELKELDLLVRWEGSPSTSYPAMSRITRRASVELREIPGVHNVSAHVGRAILSDQKGDVNDGQLRVSIDPDADYDATIAAVREVVAAYPGLSREVLTYMQARVRDELSGTRESLVVRVYGEDMGVLREKADEVRASLARIDGIADARTLDPGDRPTVEIEVDLERAKDYGLKPGDVRRTSAVLLSGMQVGSLFEEQKVFDVVVFGTPDTRHSITSIRNLLIDTPGGGHVRLGDVADVRIAPAVTVIHRDGAARSLDVAANVDGRGVAEVAADVERAIDAVNFPLEYRAELLGEYAEHLAAQRRVTGFAVVGSIMILLLIQAFAHSWPMAFAFFLTLPMALLGGVLVALMMGGGTVSIASLAGLLLVFSLAVRNGTVLIGRCQQLEGQGMAFGPDLVRQATRERVGPILTTAVATALVFLPFVLFGNVAGLELAAPMAAVVLGGLVTSTLYGVMAVPAMYALFGASREPELGLSPVSELLAESPGFEPAT
ncbi:MAG: efflux RND transporter permease subunit [Gemmatimonadota bacterium]|jgi:Cu/Ag efflux pump CusA